MKTKYCLNGALVLVVINESPVAIETPMNALPKAYATEFLKSSKVFGSENTVL